MSRKYFQGWFAKIPGDAYAMSLYDLEADAEWAARKALREWLGVSRVPNGCEFWRKS